MATLNVSLTDALDRFVEDRVVSGEFQDASEVVSAGLTLLKKRAERDARKLERLRAAIQEGLDDLEAGRYEKVTDLEAWFDEIEAEVAAGSPGASA
jgi:antitoxin ParD1/3/4